MQPIDRAAMLAPIADGDLLLEQMAERHREGLRGACAADTEIWAMYPNDWLGHFDACFDAVLANNGRCPFALTLGRRIIGMSGYLNFALDRQAVEIGNTYIVPEVRGTGVNGRIKHLLIARAFEQCTQPGGSVEARRGQGRGAPRRTRDLDRPCPRHWRVFDIGE
jgi:RimJ/RimL family protein N-acetyltransferase